MTPALDGVASRFVNVDGIRTHYLEAGSGPVVVLLHSGEFGAAAEFTWEFTIAPLAEHFRVVAPDWLGFGRTDKVFDFGPGGVFTRRIDHIRRFLEVLAIDRADVVGNSMAGTFLLQLSAMEDPPLPIRRQCIISGGGVVPLNEHRQATLQYDCTPEAMRRILRAIMHDQSWADDDAYVQRRVDMSLVPGAWQCSAAARFRPPNAEDDTRESFARLSETPYENIRFPTLLIAGAEDRLREPGYLDEPNQRIPDSRLVVLPDAGHCPNIEQPDVVNRLIVDFFAEPA